MSFTAEEFMCFWVCPYQRYDASFRKGDVCDDATCQSGWFEEREDVRLMQEEIVWIHGFLDVCIEL